MQELSHRPIGLQICLAFLSARNLSALRTNLRLCQANLQPTVSDDGISSSEYINRWTPQDVALFHLHGRLPVLTSNIHVGTASGCSIPEQVASHLTPKDDLHTARDQISPGTIQKNVRCDGCFLVSRLPKILILYILN